MWSLVHRLGHQWFYRPPITRRSRRFRCKSSAGDSGATKGRSYLEKVKGWQGPWKAAITSGTLSATGDVLAQLLTKQQTAADSAWHYDPVRTLRMFGFGLSFYGPLQYYWYALLEHTMPLKVAPSFLAKVALNQVVLGPVTLTAVFAWTAAWTQRVEQLGTKLQYDLLPTLRNGWMFWVPASAVNFFFIPLHTQVLYMSACGVVWTAYMSYAAALETQPPVRQKL